MLLSYRYKLRPTRAQYRAMDRILEAQRLLYNASLQERVEAWRKAKVSISKIDQNKSLTKIRAGDETYRAMPVALSRWAIARVDDAMTGFFGRVKRGSKAGFPRFKPMARWRSFGFVEWSGIRLKGDRLLFAPITGAMRLNMHRPLPEGASIKNCTFTKNGHHWWIAMVADVPVSAEHSNPDSAVGIDVGVAHLAATSDGEMFVNVRSFDKQRKKLRRAARALARCRRASKQRRKVRAGLARVQRSIANHRSTHLHRVSAELARRYALIGVEKLTLKNMTRSARGSADEPGTNVRQKSGLNRVMLDASLGRLIQLLTYKAERAGGMVVKVDPRGTSQDCSSCGEKVEKALSERVHRCSCGTVLDRDVNAAVNILQRALAAHGRAMPPGDGNVGHRPVRRPGNAALRAA
jgi:putative transposase